VSSTVKEVSLFSDTCSGQNRNQHIAELIIFIAQKFHFEKGHTHMEVDFMHSSIESAKKSFSVYLMNDWLNNFKQTRSKNNRNKVGESYITHQFRLEDLKDLKQPSSKMIKNRIKDSNREQIKWLKIKRLRYEKKYMGTILFSNDYESEYKVLKVNGNNRGRPRA
jgi:hypothetical protein